MRRRWFLTLSMVGAIGVIAVTMLLWQAVGLNSLSAVSEQVAAAKPYLGVLRFALMGLLIVAWPRLPGHWLRDSDDEVTARARWIALRWRVVGWLLVIELVLGQNLIGRFLTAFEGPVA